MALRGKAPEKIEKRLKALFYGTTGVGKTTAAIQFPRPYLIDTEGGSENDQYVDILKSKKGAYFFTTDADDLIAEVKELLATKHDYKTLIIDPLSIIYSSLLDRYADEVGTDFSRHKGPANRKIKHLLTLLTRLDMNVIITSHAKAKWVRAKDAKGNDTVIEEGNTFDCYDKLDYLFDLVFEVQERGNSRIGIVRKTRVANFPKGEQFPFSYDSIAEKYGRHILEKDSIAEILATSDQVNEIKRLINLLKIPAEITEKWLDKSKATTWEEMPETHIIKCIDYLKKQINSNQDESQSVVNL